MSESKTEPTVCAVMLTADRPELAKRAVECFRRQTYSRARLCVLDTGRAHALPESRDIKVGVFHSPDSRGKSISALRNLVAGGVSNRGSHNTKPPDIFAHWDDDDWSHPERIAEQVALLQSSGADCVGYNQMLFWRQPFGFRPLNDDDPGEAWLYSNENPGYGLGTSLCYWRKTWERKPFPATNVGEDLQFTTGLKCAGVSSFVGGYHEPDDLTPPRMIARIHPGNTSTAYTPEKMRANSEWKRVPEWDQWVRNVME
jgi:hypothetical protein